jgi:hypothetical protein
MIPGWALGGSDTSCGDRLCSLDHIQTFACQTGLCAPTCRTGWLDVNRPASGADDGCETPDLMTNIDNCGATGRSCSSQNVAAYACQGGVCTSWCRSGWLNVSQPASGTDDGCETIDTANR